MRLRKLLLLAAVALAAVSQAQQMPTLPNDPATRQGKLANGLTYYVRHNAYPEHIANFYIAQRVGSVQEEDSQRGLAHFLEHMAFNGSAHFKGNEMIEYLRTLGVAFGADLNAYTSIEQTVYNIDNVPTARTSALDSCLLILQDWSHGLLLLPEEIDKERGVIHGEWAMRNSAMQRLVEKNLPALYPGSRYGYRMPIGTMEVVDGFKPQELRAYYDKWYHPENQAIIVIGDIDVDRTEQKIKELFSGIKAAPTAAHVEPVAVPDNQEAILVFDKDPEMAYTVFSVNMKGSPLPRELRATPQAYAQQYMAQIVCQMFNSRMSELSQQPDCPFTQASLDHGSFLVSKAKDAFSADVVAKEGKDGQAFETLVRELCRARQYGFTATEYARAKSEFISQREKAYANRDKRKSKEYIAECVSHFLDGYAMPDADTDFQLWQMLAQQLPVDAINGALRETLRIDRDTNLVCYEFAQEKEGAQYFTAADMRQAIDRARAEKLTAWVDNVKDEPLIAKLPTPGKIKKETENKALGYTELTLSNGCRVVLKKTDYKDNEVLLSGYAAGGKSLYGPSDYASLRLFDYVASTFGLGNFTNNELDKAMAGKQAEADISLGQDWATVTGNAVPKDVETMLQLLYLRFTAPQKDEKAYAQLVGMLRTSLKNRNLQPTNEYSDSIQANLYSHNARFQNVTLSDLDHTSLDRVMQIARERFSSATPFTFTIVGNYDEKTIRQLVCQYIGALPSTKATVKPEETRTFFNGTRTCDFSRKMETPQPYISQFYVAPATLTLRNDILADYTSELLSMVLLKVVREEASCTYNIGAQVSMVNGPKGSSIVVAIQSPISKPELVDTALVLTERCIQDVMAKPDAEMVAKIKANFLKDHSVNLKKNQYWQGCITAFTKYGLDFHTAYASTVESIQPRDIAAFLRDNIMKAGNSLRVVMRPE